MMETVRVRDLVLGDGTVKICVPVIAHTRDELVRSLETVEESPFDMLEFRADFYFEKEEEALAMIRRTAGNRPVLYTIRTSEEGGEIGISDETYRERNLAAAPFVDLADIQYARLHMEGGNPFPGSDLPSKLREKGVKVVLSWHDFAKTPKKDVLVQKMMKMQKEECDLIKIAVMPNSREDVLSLMGASVEMAERKAVRPFITMAMGTLGRVTRAACALTGSCVSFGTAGTMSAPGQISAGALRQMLRVLCID